MEQSGESLNNRVAPDLPVPKVGRPPGHRNKQSVKLQELIQRHRRPIFARLIHWIRSNDGQVSLAAIKLALAYGFGKPPDRILIGNEGGKPFVVATPEMVKTQEDWDKLVKEVTDDVSVSSENDPD